jgi:hypothetical protein
MAITIKHADELHLSVLKQIDDIWKMTRDQVSALIDELYQYVPEEGPDDSIRAYFGEELDQALLDRYDEIYAEIERKRNEEVTVDGVTYKVIQFFDVYHLGWELDTKAWVVEKDGGVALVHSNHGTNYFVEDGITFLKSKVKELNGNVKTMKTSISILELND